MSMIIALVVSDNSHKNAKPRAYASAAASRNPPAVKFMPWHPGTKYSLILKNRPHSTSSTPFHLPRLLLPQYLSPPPPSTSASSGTTPAPTMPLINSPTLIRSFALIHLTTAYYLLTAPARIVNHSFVAILGVSMGLVRCPFPK